MNKHKPQSSKLFTHCMAMLIAALLLVGCSADEGPAGQVIGGTPPTIGSLTATPSTVPAGGTTTLAYTTIGAVSCEATGAWSGSKPVSGSEVVTVPTTPGSYQYGLTCTSATGQQTTRVVTVVVTSTSMPPVIGTLTATPSTVVSGGMTTIAYTTTGAVSCMRTGQWASPDAGPTSGSVPVTVPTAAGVYTYGLTCTNATGQQTSSFVNVTVLPAGGSGGGDDVVGGDDGDIVDNGDTPTDVTDGPAGPPIAGNFFCTRSARFYGDSPATTVTINGLLGDAALGGLLNMLGAGSATQLLASVSGKELAVDRSLDTFAVFNLTAGLFALPPAVPGLSGNLVSSVDLLIGLNSRVPAREYVVFGLSFPQATVEASVAQTVTISTFLGTTLQESREVSLTIVDLLGMSALGDAAIFAGYQTLLPYDSATISLNPALLSANVGNAMNVHELCTGGRFIPIAP